MPVEPVFFREVPDPLPGALSGQDAQPFEQMQQSDGHEQQSGLVVKEPQPVVEECGDTRECRSKEADREQEGHSAPTADSADKRRIPFPVVDDVEDRCSHESSTCGDVCGGPYADRLEAGGMPGRMEFNSGPDGQQEERDQRSVRAQQCFSVGSHDVSCGVCCSACKGMASALRSGWTDRGNVWIIRGIFS